MNPTTQPRPTRQPHEYAADAIADHYRRHGADRTATAALELAVILADIVDPAQLNAIADRLDLLAFGAGDAARLARGRPQTPTVPDLMQALADSVDAARDARRARLDAARLKDAETDSAGDGTYDGGDEDPADPGPEPAPITAGRYRVTFDAGIRGEARIGRTYNVPPLEAVVGPHNPGNELADAVHRVARPLLLSANTAVHVNPGPTPSAGRVVIFAGYQTAGTGTYQRIGDS